MRRVLLPLVLCLLLLAGCGGVISPNAPNCNSAFAKNKPECQGQGGGTGDGGVTLPPAATALPTEIPATPTPAPVKSEYYEGLMTRYGAYGIQMDGFSPYSSPPYHEVTEPFAASADVVNLTINGFAPIQGMQLLLVVLKMDDSAYEQSNNYSCLKVEADQLGETRDGKIYDLFYPGSEDRYAYLCGLPGHFIHAYNGWAKFMTLDPSQRGQLRVRCGSTPDTLEDCNRTPSPVQGTQTTAPTSTTAP